MHIDHGFLKGTRELKSQCWTCTEGCIVVEDKCTINHETGKKVVTVDFSRCKDGDAISWACCTGAKGGNGVSECNFSSCNGSRDKSHVKCEGVTSFSVEVDIDATSITINTHDGKTSGDANMDPACGGNGNQGGSCAGTAHCLVDLDIPQNCKTTCPDGDKEDCEKNSTTCQPKFYNKDTCTCTNGTPANTTVECVPANPENCEMARKCDGQGDCSNPMPAPHNVTCRASAGVCDIPEMCDGNNFGCPSDKFASNSTFCREAVDSCDIPETCDGITASCPCNKKRHHGYTMKCGTVMYLCGPRADELTSGSGGQSVFGGCTIGKAETFVSMSYPNCLDESLKEECPELLGVKKAYGLSNYATGTCEVDSWTCSNTKIDTNDSTEYPIVLGLKSTCESD
jgi:hypothetical protein